MLSDSNPFLVYITFVRYLPAVFANLMTRAKLSSLAGVVVLCCFLNVSPANAADNPKILVLHSYHSGFQWTDDQNSAIINSLQSAYPEGDVFVEYMNTKRVALEVMSPMLRRNYATLYRNVRFNVIIASDNNALDFLLKYGDGLFPGVPVVFCGINNFDDYNLGNHPNYTGVREDFDTGATLDIMLRFHPGTHTVAMIADVTESSQITLAIARKVVKAKKYEHIRFVELSGLSETVLADKLDNLERGTIILLLSYYRTPEGRVFSVKDGLQLIQKHTQLPLYALWDFYMLPPAIGGKIVIGRLQGEAAAEIAIRILNGEKPEAIPPYSCPTSYYFDYEALQKLHIPASLIPADSIIAGKPDTIYSRFKTYIRIGAGFALGLISTILILLRSIVLQRRNETALRANEQKYRTLAENSPDNIVRYDRNCHAIYFNTALTKLVVFDHAERLGKTPTEAYPWGADTLCEYENKIRQVLENGMPDEVEIHVPHPDGMVYTHLIRITAERDVGGNIIGALAIGRDITERKRIEDALLFVAQRGWQDSAESFFVALARYLGESLGMAYVIIDRIDENPDIAQTEVVYAKNAIVPNMSYNLKGTPCAKVMGQKPCVYPHGVQQLFPEDALLVQMGVESYIGVPLWDSAGRPVGLIAVMDSKPLADAGPIVKLLQLVAARAASELEREKNDHVLRMREQEFRTLAENSPDVIVRYDREFRRIYVNPAFERANGLSAREVLEKTPEDVLTGSMPNVLSYMDKLKHVMATGTAAEIDLDRIINGERISWFVRAIPEYDAQGEVSGTLTIWTDITVRKRLEETLAAREQEFRTLAENSPNIIIRYDRECRRTYVNPAFIRETGKPYELLVGAYPESSWLPTLPVEEYKATLRQVMKTGNPAQIAVEWPRADMGHVACHAFHLVAERDPAGQISGCLAIGHNITALKEAEAALLAKQEHLAAMAVELSLAEERERRRIAAELHDHIGQTLLLSRIKLGTLADQCESGEDGETYDEIQSLLEQTIRDVRSLTQQLNPPVLASVGFEAALEWLAKRIEEDYALQVEFVDDLSAKPLSEELHAVVFQSARELLINVAKHAGTDAARLSIGREAEMLLLRVEDRGKGFAHSPDPGTNLPQDCSFGIFNIRQRIKLLGGDVVIESVPGHGTSATIRVPLAELSPPR